MSNPLTDTDTTTKLMIVMMVNDTSLICLFHARITGQTSLPKSGVSLNFCAGGQWGFSAGHF